MSRVSVRVYETRSAHEAVTLVNKAAPCDVWITEFEVLRNVVSARLDEDETGYYLTPESEAEA
jgi:hypothetical protein